MAKIPSAQVAIIRPFHYENPVTGDHIEVSLSPLYATLTINQQEYFFVRETGEFDGYATVCQFRPFLNIVRE